MPRKASSSFDDAVESFFRHRHGISPLTERYYRGSLRRFAGNANATTIADLNAENVNRYIASIRKSKHMARGDCAVLKVFAKWLVRARILHTDPLTAVTTPDVPKSRPRPFDASLLPVIKRVAGESKMGARDRALLTLALDTGARPNELRQLRFPEDVDLARGLIRIREETSKTEAGEREIPISDESIAEIDSYVKDYRPNIVGPLFLHQNGTGLSYTGFLALHRLRDRLKAEGVEGYKSYRNRHTGLTQWARVPGMSPSDLQAVAGHKSVMTTMGYVGARTADQLRRLRVQWRATA
jgi:integrase